MVETLYRDVPGLVPTQGSEMDDLATYLTGV
jgi:hypothetical protein